jgi:hypothetical protein
MLPNRPNLFRKSVLLGITALALLAWAPPTQARVTRIIIVTKTSPAFGGQSFGPAGQYETLAGRAFGELDPGEPHNAIIQDIDLRRRTRTATWSTWPRSSWSSRLTCPRIRSDHVFGKRLESRGRVSRGTRPNVFWAVDYSTNDV